MHVCDDCFSSMYSIIMELRELQNSKFFRRNSEYLDASIVDFYTKIVIIIFDAKKTILLLELKVPVHVTHVGNKVTNFLLHSPIPPDPHSCVPPGGSDGIPPRKVWTLEPL